ncbi:MAG: hypothetical protein NXI24_01615 [bacterium]|nr:hypothetical protein [bacterium]
MRPVLGIAAHLLQILAILSLCLAVLPILYPIVTGLGLSVLLLSLLVLGLYPAAAASGAPGSEIKPTGEAAETAAEPRRFSREWIARRGTTRRAWRAARFSLIAVGLVLILYTGMRIHSRLYYEEPLNRELDPIREAFRAGNPPAKAAPENDSADEIKDSDTGASESENRRNPSANSEANTTQAQ